MEEKREGTLGLIPVWQHIKLVLLFTRGSKCLETRWGAWLKTGIKGGALCVGGMLSRLGFSQCVDTPKPPFILSIPERHLYSPCCSWSCGQDAASPMLFSFSLHPPPSCTLVFPLALPSPHRFNHVPVYILLHLHFCPLKHVVDAQ